MAESGRSCSSGFTPLLTIFCTQMYDVIASVIFFSTNNPSILQYFLVIFQIVLIMPLIHLVLCHFYFLYLAFVMLIDCFNARSKSLKKRMEIITAGNRSDDDIKRLLEDMDILRNTFEIYNKPMRPLIRNMVYLFRGALCACFFLSTIKTNPFMMLLMATFVSTMTVCFLVTGIKVSQIPSNVIALYHELNSLYGRIAVGKSIDFETRIRLRTTIKECGTQNEDGHFAMGFADGNGPSFTKTEMTELTLETIANTLMFMKIIHLQGVKKMKLS